MQSTINVPKTTRCTKTCGTNNDHVSRKGSKMNLVEEEKLNYEKEEHIGGYLSIGEKSKNRV